MEVVPTSPTCLMAVSGRSWSLHSALAGALGYWTALLYGWEPRGSTSIPPATVASLILHKGPLSNLLANAKNRPVAEVPAKLSLSARSSRSCSVPAASG